jgi:NADPH:quinone reductase-like Zn-dependent oxidoreductase
VQAPGRYWADVRGTSVLELLSGGEITAQIAGRFPLSRAAEALRFAEAGGSTGKVVIVPGAGS